MASLSAPSSSPNVPPGRDRTTSDLPVDDESPRGARFKHDDAADHRSTRAPVRDRSLTVEENEALLRIQALARGRHERRETEVTKNGRPSIPASIASEGGKLVEGWLTKRGMGYPHSWKRRYCIFVAASSTLHYFDADGVHGSVAVHKGEVRVKDVVRHQSEPLMLVFQVEASKRTAGRLLSQGGNFLSHGSRELIARAPSRAEQAMWLGELAQRI